MLIFILPSAFYLKLVKKESMKSMQKIGVRIKRKSHVLDVLFSVQCKRKILNVKHSIIPGHRLPATGLCGHDRQHEPHHPGLDLQCYSRHRGTRRRTLKKEREKGRLQRRTASERKKTKTKKQPRSNPSIKDKNKHKNSDAQLFDPLSCKNMPFRENVPELCTVPCHQPHRWCFTCIFFSLFIVNFVVGFFARFYFFSFGFSLNSYGTAENNHSKVPQLRDGVVVDLKKAASAQVRRDSRTSVGCDLRAR